MRCIPGSHAVRRRNWSAPVRRHVPSGRPKMGMATDAASAPHPQTRLRKHRSAEGGDMARFGNANAYRITVRLVLIGALTALLLHPGAPADATAQTNLGSPSVPAAFSAPLG